LSLDKSTQNHDDQPEVIIYDPRFPQVGIGTFKSSLITTMIASSNTAGDPIPPQLQFQCKGKTKEEMKLQYDVTSHMPHGQLRCA
jgi:hypothetical protein